MIGVGLRAGHIEKIGMNRASFPLNVQNLACSVDFDSSPFDPSGHLRSDQHVDLRTRIWFETSFDRYARE
jgi:hypothetical protein